VKHWIGLRVGSEGTVKSYFAFFLICLVAGASCASADPSVEKPKNSTCGENLTALHWEKIIREKQHAQHHQEEESLKLGLPPQGMSVRGVALVAHGLNLRPSRMDELAVLLQRKGYLTVRVALSGHGENPEVFARVSRELWLDDAKNHWCLARALQQPSQPLVLVGYSLGALVFQDFLLNELEATERQLLTAQYLFAPALQLRASSLLLKVFSPALWLWIPSAGLKEYRGTWATPMAAYNALFASQIAWQKASKEDFKVPTYLYLAEKDELVSWDKTQTLLNDPDFSFWKLEKVEKLGHRQGRTLHHMIIDSASFSPAEWNRVQERLTSILP
jgi:hypothetical protein